VVDAAERRQAERAQPQVGIAPPSALDSTAVGTGERCRVCHRPGPHPLAWSTRSAWPASTRSRARVPASIAPLTSGYPTAAHAARSAVRTVTAARRDDGMTEKMLTVRISEQEHLALKLYAVLQGRSVNAVVTDLISAELARQAAAGSGRSRERLAAGAGRALRDRHGQARPPGCRREGSWLGAAQRRRPDQAGSDVAETADPIVLESSVLVALRADEIPGAAYVMHGTPVLDRRVARPAGSPAGARPLVGRRLPRVRRRAAQRDVAVNGAQCPLRSALRKG
jgi:hypothetical protein